MTRAALAPLLALALKATLILALAALVERAVLRRRASAAARHLLWAVALGAVLLLPAVSWLLPAWRVALPVHAPRASGAPARATAAAPASHDLPGAAPTTAAASEATLPDAVASAPARAPERGSSGAPGPRPLPVPTAVRGATAHGALAPWWSPALLALYAAGALLLLARVAAERRLVRRLARQATPVRDAGWCALLGSVAASLGVRRPVALVRGEPSTMPLTWGVRRPTVLVPADADGWPEGRRRAVLLHELAHVARHDCLTQTLAAVACALYWPHPGVWWAAERLRAERELACDDRALGQGMRPRDYAAHLLAIARGHAAPPALRALAVTMASPSQLEARLLAAIDGGRPRRAPGPRATVLVGALAAVLLLPLAALRAGVGPAAASTIERRGAAPATRTPATTAPSTTTAATRVAPPAMASTAADRARPAPVAAPADAPADVPADAPAGGSDVGAQPAARARDGGQWWMRRATAEEAGADAPAMHVMLNTNGLNTFVVPLARLEALTAEQVASGDGAVRFRLRQDAGTLEFDGAVRAGRGSGRFVFVPDPAFADTLAALGMARPTAAQQFSMGIHGVPLALLDELRAQGYAPPTTDELTRVGLTGVELRWLREMRAAGHGLGTLSTAIALANQGVDAPYVRALAAQGYRDLSPAELRRLRVQGVDAAFATRANARAGRRLAVDELVVLRTRGETAAAPAPPARDGAVRDGAAPGDTPTGGRWVVHRTRDGVADLELFWDDGTNWRRRIAASALGAGEGGVGLRIEQDAGRFTLDGEYRGGTGGGALRFRPNRDFAAALRALGVTGADSVGDHQLKNLAWGGMSAAHVRELQALGYAPLALGDVVDLAVFQVTPAYARAMRAAGVPGAETVRGIIDLRHRGVSAR